MRELVLTAIKLYQRTWFLRRPSCRFFPSCSSYAEKAIHKHGLLRGSMLAVARLARCHPFHPGGIDEVPEQVRYNLLPQHFDPSGFNRSILKAKEQTKNKWT